MNESISSFRPDLRISPAWVIASLMAAGVVLGLMAQGHNNPLERAKLQDLTLLLLLLTILS